jgi:ABC-type nitrate/sulfonate/bicarbonate transport system substrate-binding protein
MRVFRALMPAAAGLCVVLAACGGGASAPATSAPASAAAAKPATSAATSAKPAASAAASKPAAGSSSAKPAASGLTTIKNAYSQTSAVQGPIYAASDQGFFKKYGLDVQISQVAGTAQVPAMTAGELQIGTPGGQELVSADLGGASIVMIAATSNYPLFSIYGAKGVNDIKDLTGKAVAVTTAGSSTDAAAKLYLAHFGLEKQVKIQPAGTIEGVLAVIEKGDAAGGVISPPTTVKAEQAGLKELVNGPKLGVPELHSGISVTRDYLKAHPDIVKAYLQGYLEGWDFVTNPANEAAVVKTLAKWTKTDEATAKASYDYTFQGWAKSKVPDVNPEAIQNVLSIVDNPKAKSAKPADFFDNSLIDSLAKKS